MKYDRSYLEQSSPTAVALQRAYDAYTRTGYYVVTIEDVEYVVVRTKRYNSELTLVIEELGSAPGKRLAYVRTESGWRNATEDDD